MRGQLQEPHILRSHVGTSGGIEAVLTIFENETA